MRSRMALSTAVRITMTVEMPGPDGHERREELEPVVVPIMASMMYEPPRKP